MTSADERIKDFLLRRPNLVGCGTGFVGIVAALGVEHAGRSPLLILGTGALTYIGGFLLGADWTRAAKMQLSKSDRVEVGELEASLAELTRLLTPYRKRIPTDVSEGVDRVVAQLRELLPQWGKLAGFTEQKYTVGAIVHDYLPTVLNNYLNLPDSYYRNAAKHQYGAEIVAQLATLSQTLSAIQQAVYAGVERDIRAEGEFLRTKFTGDDNELLRL